MAMRSVAPRSNGSRFGDEERRSLPPAPGRRAGPIAGAPMTTAGLPAAVPPSLRPRSPAAPGGRGRWAGGPLAVWRRLPRDARDTLFLLAVIGWTVLPHAGHLPWWCTLFAAALLGWRAQLALAGGVLPSRWTVGALLLLAGVLTLWSERTLLGKDAGVTLLVALMTLKMLELRARRDALVVFFLGFFLVLTNFLYSQSLLVALSMLLSVWGLLTALVLAHMPLGRPALARAGALAAKTALLGAPPMVVLFLLFPRVAPLWGLPSDAVGRTGLSGTLALGGLAELANDDAIALRVRFAARVPPPEAMYFRGPVLGRFDGVEWTRLVPHFAAPPRPELRLLGAPIEYELTVEPSRLAALPMLEATPELAPATRGDAGTPDDFGFTLRPDLQWQASRPLTERVRLDARAWLLYREGPRTAQPSLRDWMQLPPGYNPRTLAWATALRREPGLEDADAATLAARVLDEIRRGGYGYTLEPGPYGRDAIDEFWLDRKFGFCEHFAASFVVVMRALGVPARIVTGYQGTDPVPLDGYWIVRQSHAHAWAEYWQPGVGWVRADPTAAVAPERIRRSRHLEPRPGLVAGAFESVSPALATRLRRGWEALENRWNQWVLNYSRGQQFDLLRRLGVQSPNWADLTTALVVLLAAGASAGAAWALWDRWRQDPWQRLQRRIEGRLAALGVVVARHEPPATRARTVRANLGARGEALAALLDELDRTRYARAPSVGRASRSLRSWRPWWARFRAQARSLGA